jgi:hypothetical protein
MPVLCFEGKESRESVPMAIGKAAGSIPTQLHKTKQTGEIARFVFEGE